MDLRQTFASQAKAEVQRAAAVLSRSFESLLLQQLELVGDRLAFFHDKALNESRSDPSTDLPPSEVPELDWSVEQWKAADAADPPPPMHPEPKLDLAASRETEDCYFLGDPSDTTPTGNAAAPVSFGLDSNLEEQQDSPFGRQVSVESAAESGGMTPVRKPHETVALHSFWQNALDAPALSKSNSRKGLARRPSRYALRSGQEVMSDSFLQKLVARPSSPKGLLWDVICTLTICHDTIMIPLLTAFPIRVEGVVEIFEFASCIVWVFDIVITFLRGYIDVQTGFVEMRLRNIGYNYLTGWLVPDMCMLSSDILSLFLLDLRTVETLTLLRLFRNLRLIRLFKMASRLSLIKELIMNLNIGLEWTSLYVETAMTVLKHVLIIALLCHFTGCAWFALGHLSTDASTWITAYKAQLNLPDEVEWSFMYTLSVHWALTQFTPAAMDVVAVNTHERLFSLLATLSGLIMFSFFIGSITQSLAKLSTVTAQENRQGQLVRRYVSEHRISVELSTDILRCIRQRGIGREMSKVVFSDIAALQHLPDKVRSLLKQEVGMPILETHGIFRRAALLSYSDLAPLCSKALHEGSVVYREELFQAGGKAELMYFLRDGQLSYSWEGTPHMTEDVNPEARVCEAALWLNWEYRGRLGCASQSAHIFTLDGEMFRKVLRRTSHMDLFALYARLFLKMLADSYISIEEEASDLFGDDEQVAKMLRLSNLMTAGRNQTVDLRAVFLAWKAVSGNDTLPMRHVRKTLLSVPRLVRWLCGIRRPASPNGDDGEV